MRIRNKYGFGLLLCLGLWAGGKLSAETHWAFEPVVKLEVASEGGHPVDVLVREKLAENGMEASPIAGKRTLARRAAFDLTGLPPEPEAYEAFMNDGDAGSWERYVDALLESPAYGERWGRHWLDLARYADTQGYLAGGKSTLYPYAYTYRDWVIEAFNRDLPYDRFLKFQLAADRFLESGEAEKTDLAALGFITVGNRFLGKTPEIIDDRIDVVGRGMLGLTVSCARCHDHKFDPIPTSDYYGWYGIFASSEEPEELPLIGEATNAGQQSQFEAALAAAEGKISGFREQFWREIRGPGEVGNYLAMVINSEGKTPEQTQVMVVRAKLRERLVDAWKIAVAKLVGAEGGHPAFGIWAECEKAGESGIAEVLKREREGEVDRAILEALRRRGAKTMEEVARGYGEVIGKVAGGDSSGFPEEIRRLLEGDKLPINIGPESVDRVFNRSDREKVAKMKAEVKKLEATHPGAPPKAMVVVEAEKPGDSRVFVRGDPRQPGEVAARKFLTVLGGKRFSEGSGRKELAESVADPANPLTARVMVNRIWSHHFGTGIVDTPSDFGVQCAEPEHRKLLDFLAARFVESGWSVKAMHRLIMGSATYRQASEPVSDYLAIDPDNRLFWRLPRRRLEFEAMRDTMLAVSGELRREIGGRPFDIAAEGAGSMRRTVYAKVDRQDLPAVFSTFDFANPDAHVPARVETMVPQKALYLLNGEFAAGRARAVVGLPEFRNARSLEDKVRFLYRRLFGRDLAAGELDLAREFLEGGDVAEQAPVQATDAAWKYGYVRMGGAGEQGGVAGFVPFQQSQVGRWTAGMEYPDKEFGYVAWSGGGGHPGSGELAAVLRWTAPEGVTVEIAGSVERNHEKGNGIRASIWKNGVKKIFSGEVKPKGKVDTQVAGLVLKKGETVEFVVEAMGDASFDGFGWVPVISQDGNVLADSQRDFVKPPEPEPRSQMGRWAQFAQVLLISNEFAFVD